MALLLQGEFTCKEHTSERRRCQSYLLPTTYYLLPTTYYLLPQDRLRLELLVIRIGLFRLRVNIVTHVANASLIGKPRRQPRFVSDLRKVEDHHAVFLPPHPFPDHFRFDAAESVVLPVHPELHLVGQAVVSQCSKIGSDGRDGHEDHVLPAVEFFRRHRLHVKTVRNPI